MNIKLHRPSEVDFHKPISWLGRHLEGSQRKIYGKIKEEIDSIVFNKSSKVDQNDLVSLVDEINGISTLGDQERSMAVISEIISYLRILILSSDQKVLIRTTIVCDALVKNCGSKVHVFVGRRKFMKTLSKQARRNRKKQDAASRDIAVLLLDTIQAWGEAFQSRRLLYPHIYGTYKKLRTKHKINFPRPDFDKTRVPIFLGPITRSENQLVADFNDFKSNASDDSEDIPESVYNDASEIWDENIHQIESKEEFREIDEPESIALSNKPVIKDINSPDLIDLSTPVEIENISVSKNIDPISTASETSSISTFVNSFTSNPHYAKTEQFSKAMTTGLTNNVTVNPYTVSSPYDNLNDIRHQSKVFSYVSPRNVSSSNTPYSLPPPLPPQPPDPLNPFIDPLISAVTYPYHYPYPMARPSIPIWSSAVQDIQFEERHKSDPPRIQSTNTNDTEKDILGLDQALEDLFKTTKRNASLRLSKQHSRSNSFPPAEMYPKGHLENLNKAIAGKNHRSTDIPDKTDQRSVTSSSSRRHSPPPLPMSPGDECTSNRTQTCDSCDSRINTQDDLKEGKVHIPKKPTVINPSSDPSLEVKYFGHQRVLVKKKA